MCGRFALSPKTNSVEKLLPNAEIELNSNSFNICPSMNIEGIIALNSSIESKQNIAIKSQSHYKENLIWGINISSTNQNIQIFNSRSESLKHKSIYTELIKNHRIIIPATAYFEWQKINPKTKIPYCFRLKHEELFAFAGLYKVTQLNNEIIKEITIITCPANSKVSAIHHRMPVILDSTSANHYLNSENNIDNFFLPYPNKLMEFYRVSNLVNSPRNNSSECIQPYQELSLDFGF